MYKKMLFLFLFLISQGIDQFDDIGPSVVMASPGMMQVHYLFISFILCIYG